MTGAYLRVKREKWENIEVEYLTDKEREELLLGRDPEELLQWINILCNAISSVTSVNKNRC